MLTTETYSRAFWNSMRSKNTDGSVLKEGANLANGFCSYLRQSGGGCIPQR
jgi:hypothetical protein